MLLVFSLPASKRVDQCVAPGLYEGGFNGAVTIAA